MADEATAGVEVLLSGHDPEWATRLQGVLEEEGISARLTGLHGEILPEMARRRPLLLVLSGALHERGTERLLREIRAGSRSLAIIGLLERRDADRAATLGELGVDACLPKPVDLTEFRVVCRHLLERERLSRETGILGRSEGIHEVLERVRQYAPFHSTVLILGESGTGKELAAQGIHRLSPRRYRPFIALNCAALPEGILESELFGHEKGAFTGASSLRKGRFEIAAGGTLFLDEVGEMAPTTQVKLLRVLEEREFMRVGGTESIPVDVRLITATNRDLQEEMEMGRFRRDLYYRLKVLTIEMPPLRERRDDIPMLVNTFVRRFCAENDLTFAGITDEAMEVLQNYDWPGNVRELRNLVESMLVSAPDRRIRPGDIPEQIYRRGEPGRLLPIPMAGEGGAGRLETGAILGALVELRRDIREVGREILGAIARQEARPARVAIEPREGTAWRGAGGATRLDAAVAGGESGFGSGRTLEEIERVAIEDALRAVGGNRRRAARRLGIGERTLYRKIKAYGLR